MLKRLIAALMIMFHLISLTGCIFADSEEPPPVEITPDTSIEVSANDESPAPIPILNDKFSLRYNPDASLNPITCLDSDNLLVSALMYEPLFSLDSNFNPVPILCQRYTTRDSITYSFTIKPDIMMSDGSLLTASDAAYSIGRAASTGRFVNRLRSIQSVDVIDDSSFTITLSEPNSRFVKLLDIPIIKYGSIDNNIPAGSGPYTFSNSDSFNLVRFSGHRDYSSLPIGVVYLLDCSREELIELFSDGVISMLRDDPGGASDFYISRQHETRYYNTTALQFIGFNSRSLPLRNPLLRRAISTAVDRTYIAETIMSGRAIAAPLALPPSYELYDHTWEPIIDPIYDMSSILTEIGLFDNNNDSFLEYPDGTGGYFDFSIDFIVNNDNSYKTEAADRIATTLRRVGFNITVRKLSWSGFLEALENDDFDMFYGETVLSADFNLSPLLNTWGSLNFGNIDGEPYTRLIANFLTASNQNAEQEAARVLCSEISKNAPFIPILYKKHAMHSVRGVVSNASPTQSSVFFNLTDWIIKPGGLSAR